MDTIHISLLRAFGILCSPQMKKFGDPYCRVMTLNERFKKNV